MKSKLGLLPSRLLLSVGHDMTNGCRVGGVAALEKVTSLSKSIVLPLLRRRVMEQRPRRRRLFKIPSIPLLSSISEPKI